MSENETKVPDVLEEYFNQVEREIEAINEYFVAEEGGLEIEVEPDGETNRGWSNDPYFKVYKNNRSQVARIYITRAEYCKAHRGAEVISLNSGDKKKLIKILSRNKYEKWKKIIAYAKKYIDSKDYGMFPDNLEMPDYSKL